MTKAKFLADYRAALIANCDWALDPARLERFMQSVENTIRLSHNTWNHSSLIADKVWRAGGFKGKATLKGLRSLPDHVEVKPYMWRGTINGV
jgi:hypothetical protein